MEKLRYKILGAGRVMRFIPAEYGARLIPRIMIAYSVTMVEGRDIHLTFLRVTSPTLSDSETMYYIKEYYLDRIYPSIAKCIEKRLCLFLSEGDAKDFTLNITWKQ
jgi:hypothetical protein